MLRFSSCHAEIAEAFCKALTAFIGDKLSIPAEYIGDIPWQERERLLDRGDIHVGWVCGLPYVRKNNSDSKILELLAAPVMSHPRYGGMPVYYSDVVVHVRSSVRVFEDLYGKTWAYNEPGSHSGYNLIRYHLAAGEFRAPYFARVVESGSHQASLRMVLDGAVDAAAIDSTVLEMEFSRNPSMSQQIRRIAVLGPSPAPPWVVHASIPGEIRSALQAAFLSVDKDPRGRAILEEAGMIGFAQVCDQQYDSIRVMDRIASAIDWPPETSTP